MRESGKLSDAFNKISEEAGPFYSCAFDLSKNEVVPKEIFGLFLKRLIRLIADFYQKPFSELKILDLACLEGLFAIELARLGAQVTGIEGRSVNIKKAEFLKRFYGVDKTRFIQDDVRNISKEKYGEFDVIIAAGIFYHLNCPDNFKFIENIYAMCRNFAIVDTHISLARTSSYVYNGHEYWGREYGEFENCDTEYDRDVLAVQSSIGNDKSFWPTEVSLYNALAKAGFTSVLKCSHPTVDINRGAYDRVTVLARKGRDLDPALPENLRRLKGPELQEFIDGTVCIDPHNAPTTTVLDSPKEIVFRHIKY